MPLSFYQEQQLAIKKKHDGEELATGQKSVPALALSSLPPEVMHSIFQWLDLEDFSPLSRINKTSQEDVKAFLSSAAGAKFILNKLGGLPNAAGKDSAARSRDFEKIQEIGNYLNAAGIVQIWENQGNDASQLAYALLTKNIHNVDWKNKIKPILDKGNSPWPPIVTSVRKTAYCISILENSGFEIIHQEHEEGSYFNMQGAEGSRWEGRPLVVNSHLFRLPDYHDIYLNKFMHGADLQGAKLQGAVIELDSPANSFRWIGLRNAELKKSKFHWYIEYIDLRNSNLTEAELSGIFTHIDLRDANLAESKWTRATLAGANLDGADLTDACFNRGILNSANLRGANLTRACFDRTSLSNANLSGANLTNAHFNRANLDNANLSGANLQDAKLNGVNLQGANLDNVDISNVDFRWTMYEMLGNKELVKIIQERNFSLYRQDIQDIKTHDALNELEKDLNDKNSDYGVAPPRLVQVKILFLFAEKKFQFYKEGIANAKTHEALNKVEAASGKYCSDILLMLSTKLTQDEITNLSTEFRNFSAERKNLLTELQTKKRALDDIRDIDNAQTHDELSNEQELNTNLGHETHRFFGSKKPESSTKVTCKALTTMINNYKAQREALGSSSSSSQNTGISEISNILNEVDKGRLNSDQALKKIYQVAFFLDAFATESPYKDWYQDCLHCIEGMHPESYAPLSQDKPISKDDVQQLLDIYNTVKLAKFFTHTNPKTRRIIEMLTKSLETDNDVARHGLLHTYMSDSDNQKRDFYNVVKGYFRAQGKENFFEKEKTPDQIQSPSQKF
jgi:uncharacterized protein YjbI with pentapeptide repeats